MVMRVLRAIAGLVLMVVGVLLMLTPGPGVPIFFLGVGLVLAQSEPGRRVIWRTRLAARRRFNPDRVRALEKRLPKDVVGPHDTVELRLNLDEHREQRRNRKRR